MQSPTTVTDEETFWIRSRDVSESDEIGGDAYFDRHDVLRHEETTADDLPPAESEAVRELDEEALDERKFIGKWQLLGSRERIESLWPQLVEAAAAGTLWAVKAMTQTGFEELPYDEYMIVVYTPNYFDVDDVFRVRAYLHEEYDVTRELFYKPDMYTALGIVADSAAEFGLERPARFVR